MSRVTEIIDLLKQGYTPAEIKQRGYPHSVVSHASNAYRYARQELSAKSNTPASNTPAPNNPPAVTKKPRRGKLRSAGSDSVESKPGTLLVGGRDSQAEALLLQSKAMRLPMPELLPMAMVAARKEWNWPEDMSVTDFIDTVLWHFFASKGIFLGTYYKLEDMEQLVADAKQAGDDGATPSPEPAPEPPEPELSDDWVLQHEGKPDNVAPEPPQDEVVSTPVDEVVFEPHDELDQELGDVSELGSESGKEEPSEIEAEEEGSKEGNGDGDTVPDDDKVTIKDILMLKSKE